MTEVTVYTKPNCPQCVQTKRVLDRKNIAYSTIDLTEDAQAMEMVMGLGFAAAPVVITSNDKWSGFKLDKLNALS
jgi:glutaredoxin-like protein NrdH